MMRSCLIALAVLHMGCNPQSKTSATPKESKQTEDSVSQPKINGTASGSSKLKTTKTKTTTSVSTDVAGPLEEQDVQLETVSSGSSKSPSAAPKATKQKMRTSPQKTASSETFTPSASGSPTTCESLCDLNSVCKDSDRKSFCRWDKAKPNCFGLYWKDSTRQTVCYHPFEQGCSEEYPVECGVLKPIMKTKAVETVDFLSSNTCTGLCKLATGCNNSVCTADSFCSGLYWKDKLLHNRNTVIHQSQLTESLPDHQRVLCGVYDYIA